MTTTFDLITGSLIERIKTLEQQLAELRSQPRLQRVTPEAMAELERCDECEVILFLGIGAVLRMSWKRKIGWLAGSGMISARPRNGWFIDLATIPETPQ